MIICSLVLTLMRIYLYIRSREEDDRDAAFTGAAVFLAGLAGVLLGFLWPVAAMGCLL